MVAGQSALISVVFALSCERQNLKFCSPEHYAENASPVHRGGKESGGFSGVHSSLLALQKQL